MTKYEMHQAIVPVENIAKTLQGIHNDGLYLEKLMELQHASSYEGQGKGD